ncbi:hypothetical protein NEOLEDRAFT_1133287 [Neolentinus lepideus HHB14362 ss-1]|uniref:Uncharacterized protein n=1 Tax=Neolentinus lepideus HHB14362 ss-1 TaxID=1314782 RepID=A0A165SVT5_9AGAM|nr:hypothetical protein NEOLEDRAFT_1133287 [Neolentinus lepideus HHB14362 ss-1]
MLTRISSPDSPLSSPPTSPSSALFKVVDVASLFLKLRPASSKANSNHIDSSSGSEYMTHPTLQDDPTVGAKKLPLIQEETFIVVDAVDVRKLVRASRAALLDKAKTLGANCLVDERWSCTVHPTKSSGNHATYKVHVTYEASAARTSRRDPRTPPALENSRGVPGLMTILKRL